MCRPLSPTLRVVVAGFGPALQSHLKSLARIGQASLAHPLPAAGSWFSAARRNFLLGESVRLFWLKASVVVALCTGLAMCPRLWVGPRSFPPTPVFAGLSAWPPYLSYSLFYGLFALGALAVLRPNPRRSIAAFLLVVAVFCLFDQTRWQPWVFLYVSLLATLAVFSWDSEDEEGRRRALNLARLIVASTYVFSGLQKTNVNFFDYDFPWIVQPITNAAPMLSAPLHLFGMAVPFIQVAFGIGLLTQRFRRVALVLAVSMHVFILAMFGPFGHNWNTIVWPWTAAMALFDVILFSTNEQFRLRDIFRPAGSPYCALVLAVFAIAPLLSFVNLWDSYLSAALYSGNLTEGEIYASDAGKLALPPQLRTWFVHSVANTNVLNVQRWAVEDLNAMPYPETRVYKKVARQLCDQAGRPDQIVLVVREQRMFRSAPETGYRCRDLR